MPELRRKIFGTRIQGKVVFKLYLTLFLIAQAMLLPAARAQSVEALRTAWQQGEFGEVIHLYANLPQSAQSLALPQFWVGNSYMRRHDYRSARPFLERAVGAHLPDKQKQVALTLLSHIKILSELCPPFWQTFKSKGMLINVYARKSAWANSLVAQMPQFLARANEAFPGENADVNFYLFDEREPYDRFFSAWRAGAARDQNQTHRGTGGFQIVEFCQYFPSGAKIGATNINDMYGRCLHEYSHALCATIYGDKFAVNCPQWLNESMADYFGFKYRPELCAQQASILAGLAKKFPPPPFEQMARNFYDGNFGYTFANVILLDLLQGKQISCYKQIIAGAKANGGNFEQSLIQVTGKNPKEIYRQIVERTWR